MKYPGECLTKAAEEEALDYFLQTVTTDENVRYCVGLLWLEKHPDIPSNRHIAERRLFSTTRKLKIIDKYQDYDKVLREWEEKGVIEKVPLEELQSKGHQIPHYPVIKPGSLLRR